MKFNAVGFSLDAVNFPNCLTKIQAESRKMINTKVEDHDFPFSKSPRLFNLIAWNSSYEFWSMAWKA